MPLDPTKTSKTLDAAKTIKLTGDADVGDVKAGKKFYKDDPDTQLTGTMPTKAIVAANDDYEEGYHAGNPGGLDAIDTDLAPANIKEGVTIFGKLGTFVGGPIVEDVVGEAGTALTATGSGAYSYSFFQEGATEFLVASKTLTFDANSRAVAVGYWGGRQYPGTSQLRLYMDGALEASVDIGAGYDNYIVIATKALSGSKTCQVKLYYPGLNYGLEGFGKKDGGVTAGGIAVGSLKL